MHDEKCESCTCDEHDVCQKCEEYLTGWKRALADYDNLKKELFHERTSMHQAAVERVADQLIPVLDNFDQAVKCKPEGLNASVEQWLQGMLHVRTQLEQLMREMGIEPFGEVNEAFDPHRHDAVSERPAEDQEPGTILEVIQRGWKRSDRIIRPAKVIISTKDDVSTNS